MTPFRLILRTLKHFFASNVATAGGVAIATAVVCGALIIGDSLKKSLEQVVEYRLGMVTHTVTAGERIFSKDLSLRMAANGNILAAPVLKTEAIASIQGNNLRVNQVQVWGIDSLFADVAGPAAQKIPPGENEIVISESLAYKLMADTGDYLLLRLKSIGPIPLNTPLVSESGQTVTRRVKISAVVAEEHLGRFNMQSSQSAVYNAFVDIDWLNQIMDLNYKANMVMIRPLESVVTQEIAGMVRDAWQPEDGNLNLEQAGSNLLLLRSDRVFIDNYFSKLALEAFPEAVPSLTYFVNAIEFDGKVTPYSFVTASDHFSFDQTLKQNDNANLNGSKPLKPGQAIINQWLADDLGLSPGDSLTMRFFEIGPLRELLERESRFQVAGIISMESAQPDSILVPHLPGLSDAGNCRDWEAGIPIDLDAIRQKDEDYWDVFRGTPKAYISLEQGRMLWQNRFGNATTITFSADEYTDAAIRNLLGRLTDPEHLGFKVNAVREQGMIAARNGVDFGQLFGALGIFIIVSGGLLTMLFLSFNLKRRQLQIRLFSSLGFPDSLIRKILFREAFVVALAGVLAGLAISVGYSKAVFAALNHNWYDIVRTSTLSLHFELQTLFTGLLISFLLGLAVVYHGIRKAIKDNLPGGAKSSPGRSKTALPAMETGHSISQADTAAVQNPTNKLRGRPIAGLSAGLFVIAIALAVYLGMAQQFEWLFAWLTSGILLLLSMLMGMYHMLFYRSWHASDRISLTTLSRANMARNSLRSFTIILLLALGSFVIVVTAANRKQAYTDSSDKASGTGGFQYMAEVTVPILRNLNLTEAATELGLPENIRYVQFLSAYDDDASCLNLNMVANPRILATDPGQLAGRFSFAATHELLDADNPWLSLDMTYNGVVPAIADQTVIQWGLGKKVGDTLVYVNARGEEVKLLLIGGLANSVFQGNVIISEKNFLNHFPTSGGSDVILIEANNADPLILEEDLGLALRDHGWEMTGTLEKLAGFNSVENTYLQIFFLMGAFGMLLGTIGLAVIMAKSMVERRAETALLRSLGFSILHIIRLYFYEYAVLFLAGMLSGTLAALLATLPNFISASQNISTGFLASVILILLINGIAWMLFIPLIMIKKLRLIEALRNE